MPESVTLELRLTDIIKTLPRECFQQNSWKAWASVLTTIFMVSLGEAGIAIAPWFLLPPLWIFTGTAATGLFVIAHDCGHRAFAKERWVNDLVGHLFMLPLIYPFHSWRIQHNYHHTHTNKLEVDNAWHPLTPELYESWAKIRQWTFEKFINHFWWVGSIAHWVMKHFDWSQFEGKERSNVKLSVVLVVIFAAIAFPLLIATTGVWGFVKFWLMPWLVFHFWLSTFTLVHHTDPEIPFSTRDRWDAVTAQLSGTVHCNYPRWVEILCYDINVHVPHHVSTAIPSYNLRLAYSSLQQNWGTYLCEERQFSWSLLKRITNKCHLYSPGDGYSSFKDYSQAGR